MTSASEFSVRDVREYNRSSPTRWVFSHVLHYWPFALTSLAAIVGAWLVYSYARVLIGEAAAALTAGEGDRLLWLALATAGLLVADGMCMLTSTFAAENIAARFEANARHELYASLLGKSQVYHDRQRVGDLMARATDDTSQLASMIVPASTLIIEAMLGLVIPLMFIGMQRLELLLVPLIFVACYIVAVRRYMRKLNVVMVEQRGAFGALNTGLEETISGVEVVKASASEPFELGKYRHNAQRFRDLFVRQGALEARYLPLLLFGLALAGMFMHALLLWHNGVIGIAEVVSATGLMLLLRFPTFISIFAFSLFQAGLAGAGRILEVLQAETELDQNSGGHRATLQGGLAFEGVSFSYDDGGTVLRDISFTVQPGQTVAIVGQTGSGKTALTQLVNRTYDVSAGRVTIDGVDVRQWDLDSLRSQIARIEQDVFLFSRTVRENIAFGRPGASQEEIEAAAKAAQAHDFISALPLGYDTEIGERGVTLSGGQRQRLAIARAFLSDPRILILDDSTSAIDSATEDQIQRAMREIQRGRTTLLITHRLSQIRWADLILVLEAGQLVAAGGHEQLLRESPHYQRIFGRFREPSPGAAAPPSPSFAGRG